MPGMELLDFSYVGTRVPDPFEPVLVGVVASGNLEVLLEPIAANGCTVHVETSAPGFGKIWDAVLQDFHERHRLGGVAISINDMGATPAIVALRLDQAASSLSTSSPSTSSPSTTSTRSAP